jgi:hypothetical protein
VDFVHFADEELEARRSKDLSMREAGSPWKQNSRRKARPGKQG